MQLDRGMIEEWKAGRGGGWREEGLRWRRKIRAPYFINARERCSPCSFQGRTRESEVVGFTPTTLYWLQLPDVWLLAMGDTAVTFVIMGSLGNVLMCFTFFSRLRFSVKSHHVCVSKCDCNWFWLLAASQAKLTFFKPLRSKWRD